jgi:hypothetical protein
MNQCLRENRNPKREVGEAARRLLDFFFGIWKNLSYHPSGRICLYIFVGPTQSTTGLTSRKGG